MVAGTRDSQLPKAEEAIVLTEEPHIIALLEEQNS